MRAGASNPHVERAAEIVLVTFGRVAAVARQEAPDVALSVVVLNLAGGFDLPQVGEKVGAPTGAAEGAVAEHARAIAPIDGNR